MKISSLFGAVLLVAGSCIGAGMLALPILTGLAGFFPAIFLLACAWAFMTYTGFLLIEVTSQFPKQVNLLSMAEKTLGKKGKLIAFFSYLFLFYSLLVAYISASGSIFSSLLLSLFGWNISEQIASICFTGLFGYLIYLGTHLVDLWNRALMIGLLVSYFGLIGLGLVYIEPEKLFPMSPEKALLSLPILAVSFGFQNMIPSLMGYLEEKAHLVRQAILGGGLLSFLIYLFWILLVLGVVPPEQIALSYAKGEEASLPLSRALSSSAIAFFAQAFAFFAIVTSFLAQGLTLTHFLADGLKKAVIKRNLAWLSCLALFPPLLFALSHPQVFFRALGVAGGIFAMILFGILPVCMVWKGRSLLPQHSRYKVKGGKPILITALSFALLIIGCELFRFFIPMKFPL